MVAVENFLAGFDSLVPLHATSGAVGLGVLFAARDALRFHRFGGKQEEENGATQKQLTTPTSTPSRPHHGGLGVQTAYVLTLKPPKDEKASLMDAWKASSAGERKGRNDRDWGKAAGQAVRTLLGSRSKEDQKGDSAKTNPKTNLKWNPLNR
jgi:hypothetical protein